MDLPVLPLLKSDINYSFRIASAKQLISNILVTVITVIFGCELPNLMRDRRVEKVFSRKEQLADGVLAELQNQCMAANLVPELLQANGAVLLQPSLHPNQGYEGGGGSSQSLTIGASWVTCTMYYEYYY